MLMEDMPEKNRRQRKAKVRMKGEIMSIMLSHLRGQVTLKEQEQFVPLFARVSLHPATWEQEERRPETERTPKRGEAE